MVQVAAVAALLAVHLVLVPPLSVAGTAAAYAGVLLGATALAALAAHPRIRPARRGVRVAVSGAALAVLVAGLAGAAGWADRANRPPAAYPVLAGTPVDTGRGAAATHAAHLPVGPGVVDVASLTGPAGRPDRAVTLTAQRSGERWTYDGTVPGPQLRVRRGELLQVTLVNRDVPAGVTLHWHGLDVPNAEDGVAGVTQDAVPPGGRHVYRFRPEQVGTFWYHSYQLSSEQVSRGLAGVIVVEAAAGVAPGADLALLDHPLRAGAEPERRTVAAGTPVRLRVVNANDRPQRYSLAGTPFRVAAIDGTDLAGPTEVTDERVRVAAGGRYDLAFTMPATPVALYGAGRTLLLSADGGARLPADRGRGELDPLSYGSPAPSVGRDTPIGPDSRVDRDFRLVIDQRMAFSGLGFGWQWSMNGRVWPDSPTFTVREGDLVRTTVVNRSTADHPMHLHGHHLLVLSRDGEGATGSPWWTDTLNVGPGETYEVMFRADNPGIWMDHCHNLAHARAGFVMHLAYSGVGTRFQVGEATGNEPE